MPYLGRTPAGAAGNKITGDLKVTGVLSADSINNNIVLDGTDGSSSNATDNVVMNGTDSDSTNADDNVLYEENTGDMLVEKRIPTSFGTDGQVFTSTGSTQSAFEDAGGGLLQMVHVEISTEPSITTGTTYTDIAGLSLSITPASTSNKILVTFNAGIVGHTSNTVAFILERDIGGSTTLLGGHTSLTRQMAWIRYDSDSDGNHDSVCTGIYYDTTHNTTSAITYKVQWMSQGTAYLNRSASFENNTYSYASLPNTRFFAQEIGV